VESEHLQFIVYYVKLFVNAVRFLKEEKIQLTYIFITLLCD